MSTGHAPEKIAQSLCAGQSRQVPENLCERYAGTSKNVQRLCASCAGVHLHNSCRTLGWSFRECGHTRFAQFSPKKLNFSLKWVGVKFVMCCVFLGKKGNTETKFPGDLRKRPGQSRDSPRITPGQSREKFVEHARKKNLSGPVLRDTARLSQRSPPIARYGVFGVSTWPIECDIPYPPF